MTTIDDYKEARNRLSLHLRQMGIEDERVLKAIQSVPRHLFMDKHLWGKAYEDIALPIECDQTISQPFIVAQMTSAILKSTKGRLQSVLEIGTGSGYQTAILSYIADKVYTIERIEALSTQAKERFQTFGLHNIQVIYGDGYTGWPEAAPYPAIIVTAAPEILPEALPKQLAMGGVMIIPVGLMGSQQLMRITRLKEGYEHTLLEPVRFVPLLPGIRKH